MPSERDKSSENPYEASSSEAATDEFKETPRRNKVSRLPAISLIMVLASIAVSSLASVLYSLMGNAGTELSLFLGLGCALAGLLLGIVGFVKTRGERFLPRLPAVIGAVLGGILALFYAFVLFLLFTPNAPF